MSTSMTAILLAAGRGSRLGSRTEARPKCLMEVGGSTLLAWWLDHLSVLGVRDVAVVGGYRAEQVFREAQAYAGHLQVREILSPRWETTNNLVSLAAAALEVRGPVLIVETDVLMVRPLVERTLAAPCTVVDVAQAQQPGTTVADVDGWVHAMQVGAHPWSTMLPWKTVNVTHLDGSQWEVLGRRLLALERAGRVQEYWERALAELVDEGALRLRALPTGTDYWCEIDTEDDLQAARRAMSAAARRREMVGHAESAVVAGSASV